MRGWLTCAIAAALTCAAPTSAATPALDPEAILRAARTAWHARTEEPYVQYGVRTQYDEGSQTRERWWEVTYRASDGAVALERIPQEGDDQRLRGTAFSIFGVTLFDTNPDAEVVSSLREPAIEPAFTFGLMPRGYRPVAPAASASPAPFGGGLPEIGEVYVTEREYRVTLAGIDRLRYGTAYHLVLEPLRDPRLNRLRDVWVATEGHTLLQESVAGILDVRPYDAARWTVRYVPLHGRMYIQQIRTDDALHFGTARVTRFRLDFVDYRFPPSVPPHTFEHWL